MVGCRFFGLKMIPYDRGRSAQGPPRGFRPENPDSRASRGSRTPGPSRFFCAFFRMWPHTNGWAPCGISAAKVLTRVRIRDSGMFNRTGPEILEFSKPEIRKPDRTRPKLPTTGPDWTGPEFKTTKPDRKLKPGTKCNNRTRPDRNMRSF